jgi:hypothetical protein
MKANNFQLDELYPAGRPNEKLQHNDLQSLLPYITSNAHQFYTNLKPNGTGRYCRRRWR